MNPLFQLIECGQSYWLDNLTRDMLTSGELHKRVTEQGLRGMTSNPATFHKAIVDSRQYDAQIRRLVDEGRALQEIYEQLAVTDVRNACDLLQPVYDATDGADGFVSLEVSPYLAHDTLGTMQEVHRLFTAVDRPNVLIKIPGTPAGVPAIEEMLHEGININITLLFAIKDYEAVAQACMRALERRVAEGKPVRHVASVASFFLSRIDVLVDQLLEQRIQPSITSGNTPRPEQLLGKVAIANTQLAYQSFKRLFSSERWQALAAQGARVQRPLWASTGTKDPLYHDTRYVEPLIAPYTVNTIPAETIAAFADHGRVTDNAIEADLEEAHRILRDLERVGLDLGGVTWQLQHEGVQKFAEPYDALMQALAIKRQELLGQRASRQTMAPGKIASALTSTCSALDRRQFGRRLWARDPLLWRTTDQEGHAIRQRLGWLDSLTTFRSKVDEIRRFATEVKDQGYSHVVLLGMGGSSLWPQVCRTTFGAAPGWPHLLVLDNTDPSAIREVASQIHLLTTLFLVASKSGTTIETLSFYRYFRALIGQQAPDHVGDHFVAITDAGAPLAEEAQHYRFRRCFETPEDIGGRYAALSYFGLVPMALLGIDIAALLERAHQMQVSCGPFVPAATNPGLSLGTLLGMAARHGRNKVTFVLAEPIGTFGDEHPVVEENGMAIYRAGAPGNHRTVHNALKAFVDAGLETVAAPDYLAFLPYWRYTPERHEMLQNLRLALRNRCKVATTLGYGPRYLHATGQLHKGGPYTAVLLMLTADAPEDLPIPGEPFGFATLQRAQALGDFQALAAKGRRVLRIHLGQDVDHGLERLVQSLR